MRERRELERRELETRIAWAFAAYLPHLLEEALTGMHEDPVVAPALSLLLELPPRHAVYLTFQLMMVLLLAAIVAYSRGGRPRLLVLGAIGVALLGEAHHVVRAVATLSPNSGLVTSLPMPFVGSLLLGAVARAWRLPASTLLPA